MVRVFKFVPTEEWVDRVNLSELINDDLHTSISYTESQTLCGIQLDAEDGIKPGECINGPVTCAICLSIIEEIKSIRKWRIGSYKKAIEG